MAGYWPSFFCVFMDQNGVEAHKLVKKIIIIDNEANIQSSFPNRLGQ